MASCSKIDGLSMRHRIEVQSETRTEDGAGGWTRTWATDLSAWASIQPLSGWEKFQASQVETDVTHKIIMRYQPGVTTAKRIKFGTRLFNIAEVLNIDERSIYLQIMAVEGAGI